MPRGDRRAEILDVAERLFAEGRFHEVTMDDVAREAKVGKGTIYRYFSDKDALFFQTLMRGFDQLCERLKATVPVEAPFEEQLLTACREVHATFESRRRRFRLMQGADGRPPWPKGRFREQFKAHHDRLDAVLAGIIERGVTEGKVRCDLPPVILARMLAGMQMGWARRLDETPESASRVDCVVEVFCRGVAPCG